MLKKKKIKLKTRKSIFKRFKITAKKKIKFRSSGKSHKLLNKNSKRIRKLNKNKYLKNVIKSKIIKFIK